MIQGYWIYEQLVNERSFTINVKDITKENWVMHHDALLNLIRDYIDSDIMDTPCITIVFDESHYCVLGVQDYWYNIIMWYLIVIPPIKDIGRTVERHDLFFPQYGMTRNEIKNYVDTKFIDIYRTVLTNIEVNNIIDDTMYYFLVVDDFGMALMSTINLEQCFLEPMMESQDIREVINLDLSDVDLKDAKNVAVDGTAKLKSYIMKNKNNPLYDFFISKESIKDNQFREVAVSIAQKPDGHGGIYSVKLETSLITGGSNTLMYYYIESSTGRTAQIILEDNIGKSGNTARLLGLVNMDTVLHPDPHYACNTKHLLEFTIPDKKQFNRYIGRYYRLTEDGYEYKIGKDDFHIIGRKIYLRSPMTCASKYHEGICYRCYGDLAYANRDISIGKYAAELISSGLTQKMLSAKHLLEASVIDFKWTDGFDRYFENDSGMILCKETIDVSDKYIVFDYMDIYNDDEDICNKNTLLVNEFEIYDSVGNTYEPIHTLNKNAMHFTLDMINIFSEFERRHAFLELEEDGCEKIGIPLKVVKDLELFAINLVNNDLSDSLYRFNSIINKVNNTRNYTLVSILEDLNKTSQDIGMNIQSVHMEVLISNQIRDGEDYLLYPDWSDARAEYCIYALRQCLIWNPSITKSLSYQCVNSTLVNPVTYKKNESSIMDLFFMEQPQEFLGRNVLKHEE